MGDNKPAHYGELTAAYVYDPNGGTNESSNINEPICHTCQSTVTDLVLTWSGSSYHWTCLLASHVFTGDMTSMRGYGNLTRDDREALMENAHNSNYDDDNDASCDVASENTSPPPDTNISDDVDDISLNSSSSGGGTHYDENKSLNRKRLHSPVDGQEYAEPWSSRRNVHVGTIDGASSSAQFNEHDYAAERSIGINVELGEREDQKSHSELVIDDYVKQEELLAQLRLVMNILGEEDPIPVEISDVTRKSVAKYGKAGYLMNLKYYLKNPNGMKALQSQMTSMMGQSTVMIQKSAVASSSIDPLLQSADVQQNRPASAPPPDLDSTNDNRDDLPSSKNDISSSDTSRVSHAQNLLNYSNMLIAGPSSSKTPTTSSGTTSEDNSAVRKRSSQSESDVKRSDDTTGSSSQVSTAGSDRDPFDFLPPPPPPLGTSAIGSLTGSSTIPFYNMPVVTSSMILASARYAQYFGRPLNSVSSSTRSRVRLMQSPAMATIFGSTNQTSDATSSSSSKATSGATSQDQASSILIRDLISILRGMRKTYSRFSKSASATNILPAAPPTGVLSSSGSPRDESAQFALAHLNNSLQDIIKSMPNLKLSQPLPLQDLSHAVAIVDDFISQLKAFSSQADPNDAPSANPPGLSSPVKTARATRKLGRIRSNAPLISGRSIGFNSFFGGTFDDDLYLFDNTKAERPLLQLLKANGIPYTTDSEAAELLADAAIFGALVPSICPSCNTKPVIFCEAVGKYICKSAMKDVCPNPCFYETELPARVEFVIPETVLFHVSYMNKLSINCIRERMPRLDIQQHLLPNEPMVGWPPEKAELGTKPDLSYKPMCVKNNMLLDPEFVHARNCRMVLDDEDKPFAAVMTHFDLKSNKNQYLKIHVYHHEQLDRYFVFSSFGRIGANLGNCSVSIRSTRKKALKEAEEQFYANTGMLWKDRKMQEGYRMRLVDIDFIVPAEGLDSFFRRYHMLMQPSIRNVMDLIYQNEVDARPIRMKLRSNMFPLGRLTPQQIDRGIDALYHLMDALESGDEYDMGRWTNEFYSLIPHDFGLGLPEPLDSTQAITEKVKLLGSFMALRSDFVIPADDGEAMGSLDIVHELYQKTGCSLEVLPHLHDDYKIISQYLQNTSPTMKLTITDLFRIVRPGDAERFLASMGNRRLLWHGSRSHNFRRILGEGLLVSPDHAQRNGSMYGTGIYFADMADKAFQYCRDFDRSFSGQGKTTPARDSLLLLADVALGRMMTSERERGNYGFVGLGRGRPKDDTFDSLLGGDGTLPPESAVHNHSDGYAIPYKITATEGRHNEYVVYQPEQVRLRYLVRVRRGTISSPYW